MRLVRGGFVIRSMFADRSFGGREPARTVATAYREAVLAVVPPLAERNPHSTRRQKRDRPHSELSHVYFDPANACWLVRVQLGATDGARPPRLVTRRFGVATHGHDEARRRAEAERTHILQALENGWDPRCDPGASGDAACDTPGGRTHTATNDAILDPSDPDYAIRRLSRPQGADDGGANDGSEPADAEPVGWAINLTRRARNIQMAFWDVTYGGRDKALFVARRTRDAMLAVLPPLTKCERRQIVRRTREPGTMPGVTYFAGTPTRASYWVATINLPAGPNGKRRNKVRWFNADWLGNDEARHQAEAERTRMLDELEDGDEPVLLNRTARALHERLGGDCSEP